MNSQLLAYTRGIIARLYPHISAVNSNENSGEKLYCLLVFYKIEYPHKKTKKTLYELWKRFVLNLTMIGHCYYGNPFSIIVSKRIIELKGIS